ncbi:MAG: ABC transporter ATP-binding protein [Bacteroidales bacterium]|nr:ABC transporter ATP-binding protein [Candidatus Scybalousia scybalohippi]
MEIIKAENISVSVKEKDIIKDVNFSLEKGDFCCVVGVNGSGKSTLLKTLCRTIPSTSGEVFIEEENIKALSVKNLAKKVSVVFQSADIDLDFSALQIVLMGRMPYQRILQQDKKEDLLLAEEAMRRTNTWELKDRSFPTLSGGEKQRVMIARSLCQNTSIMLLDEPIASLDVKHQFEIMELLKQINKENKVSIFMILHDLSLALQYANKILAMKDGRMKYFGVTKEVLTKENIETLFEVKAEIINNNNIILKK